MLNIVSRFIAARRLVALLGFACVVSSVPTPAGAVTTTQSMAIPAYEYPTLTNLWPFIDANSSQIPFVIVNPASGPGVSTNSDYTTRIAANNAANIKSIGYVDTSYQARPYTDVINDIDLWYSLYPGVQGIFLDQVSATGAPALCYSAYIYNYAKIRHVSDPVMQNFGTYTTPAYEPYGDIFANAEMDHTLYQTWTLPTDGFQDVAANANRFWHLIHTTDGSDLASTLTQTRNNNAGWVYITDDTLPNPYDTAPTYGSAELTGIASLPASTIPNRGITALPAGCLDTTTNTSSTSDSNSVAFTGSVTNQSTIYSLPSDTTSIRFALPTGVSIASFSGTGWNCSGTTCAYSPAIAALATSPQLNVTFTVDCSYQSGTIGATSTVFPNTTSTSQLSVPAASGCPSVASTLASTGDSQYIVIAIGLAMTFLGATRLWALRQQTRN